MPRSLRDALNKVIKNCPDSCARSYARALLRDGNWLTPDERRHQILYILANTGYWRGQEAREVKSVLSVY